LILLQHGAWRAAVAPEAGGRLAQLAWTAPEGTVHDLLVPWDGSGWEPDRWPKAGAFPMLPFANRLPGLPQHGFGHRQPWQVVGQGAAQAVLRLRHDGASAGWRWPFDAELQVRLDGAGAGVRLTVRNTGEQPLPLGLGWHPYHPGRGDDLVVNAAKSHGLDERGRALDEHRAGDTIAFSGWNGRASWTLDGRRRAQAVADGSCVVVHRPVSRAWFCVEPVTVLPGRLAEAPPLEPGDSRSICWRCAVG
jgi:aldose 1-epimerase